MAMMDGFEGQCNSTGGLRICALDTENGIVDTEGGEDRVEQIEKVALMYVSCHV